LRRRDDAQAIPYRRRGVGATTGFGGTIAGIGAWCAGNIGALATATGVMMAGQASMPIGPIADAAPCPDPYCEEWRVKADQETEAALDPIPATRAQTRMVAP
jgi:hypothetical protein